MYLQYSIVIKTLYIHIIRIAVVLIPSDNIAIVPCYDVACAILGYGYHVLYALCCMYDALALRCVSCGYAVYAIRRVLTLLAASMPIAR